MHIHLITIDRNDENTVIVAAFTSKVDAKDILKSLAKENPDTPYTLDTTLLNPTLEDLLD